MRIEFQDVKGYVGKELWYFQVSENPDPFKKLDKHTKPTKVNIKKFTENKGTDKNYYRQYSKIEFNLIGKSGRLLKKIGVTYDYEKDYSPFFDNEEECLREYREFQKKRVQRMINWVQNIADSLHVQVDLKIVG